MYIYITTYICTHIHTHMRTHRGSMRYVHVGCLNRWRSLSNNPRSYYQCDSCNYKYNLQRTAFANYCHSYKVCTGKTTKKFLGKNMQICAIYVTLASADTVCNAQPSHTITIHTSAQLFCFRTALPVCLVHLRIKNLQRTSFGKVPPFVQGGRVFFPPAAEPHFWWLVAKRILQEIKPATHCNTLQHTAPYCNALQHTPQHIATYSNILHQMARNSIL